MKEIKKSSMGKNLIQYPKEFLNTLAGKLTVLPAFALLAIIVLGVSGRTIPEEYSPLVYILVIVSLLALSVVAVMEVREKRKGTPPEETPSPKITSDDPAATKIAGQDPPAGVDASSARECYLRSVINDCQTVRLAGLDPDASDPNRGGMSLEKLYISLDTQTQREQPEGKKTDEFPFDKGREPLSALEAWLTSEGQRMVLLGLPGTGKSTFVRYLALSMARVEIVKGAEVPDGWKGRPTIPFMISLGRFAETLPAGCQTGHASLIEDYLVQSLKKNAKTMEFSSMALKVVASEGALVMFDGLDEVANMNLRPIVVQAVNDFVLKYSRNPSNYFLVTCRTYSYQHDSEWKLTGWDTHELALLSREKIKYFVNAWYKELVHIDSTRKDEYERKCKELLETLQPDDRRRLLEIAAFPLILTIMAVVHTHFGSLPDTRAEVYERCVELLLIRWQGERSVEGIVQRQSILDALKVPPTVLYQALWEVAYKAHGDPKRDGDKGSQTALVTEELLFTVLKVFLQASEKVDLFMEYCQSSNGLLMLQGTISSPGKPARKVYAFPHLTFEEYLAARYLADEDPEDYVYELVGKSDRWHEAIKLLGEHLCFGSPSRTIMSAWLKALANPPKSATQEEKARMTWLAGDLLVLYRRAFPSKEDPSDKKIFTQLHKTAITFLPDARIRANCADLGDELGFIPDDLFVFLRTPDHLSPGTRLAKYPVTNAQYERFLKPWNFEDDSLWTGLPSYDENGKVINKSLDKLSLEFLHGTQKENGCITPRFWQEARFGKTRPHAPVVGISWFEANAYCRWLHKNWENLEESRQGFQKPGLIRLPTAFEWVLAAGGEADGRFAWGNLKKVDEISRYSNTVESGINRSTPVWMYPQGASEPFKVMDMSGNVWEWQANFYDKDHDVLALRGGSWSFDPSYARVSNSGLNPLVRDLNVGFRVVMFFLSS